MKNLLVTLLMAISLVGCSMIEPSAKNRFNAKPGTPTESVFVCAESTISLLSKQRGLWSDMVTTRNTEIGLLETDYFSKVNIVGIRSQIKYSLDTGEGRVKVKASGPYFFDLGAEQAAVQLTDGIKKCL